MPTDGGRHVFGHLKVLHSAISYRVFKGHDLDLVGWVAVICLFVHCMVMRAGEACSLFAQELNRSVAYSRVKRSVVHGNALLLCCLPYCGFGIMSCFGFILLIIYPLFVQQPA